MEADFPVYLRRTLRFVQTSAAAYDAGDREEAVRIAVSLRVLFHDTRKSTSLLAHMKIKDQVRVLTTFMPGHVEDPKTGITSAVILLWASPTDLFIPPLENTERRELVSAAQWWNEVVFSTGRPVTRKDIILAAANQDGGAHVDADLGEMTSRLIEGSGYVQAYENAPQVPLSNQHFPMIRQFAYEVLNSPSISASAQR